LPLIFRAKPPLAVDVVITNPSVLTFIQPIVGDADELW
jgi:hypothetical protein